MTGKDITTESEIIKEVVEEFLKFQLAVPAELVSTDEFKTRLSDIINDLIENDFSRLIDVLYRLDISEEKLKKVLKSTPGTLAGDIIADMILERQAEKIRTRKLFSGNDASSDEEKW